MHKVGIQMFFFSYHLFPEICLFLNDYIEVKKIPLVKGSINNWTSCGLAQI